MDKLLIVVKVDDLKPTLQVLCQHAEHSKTNNLSHK